MSVDREGYRLANEIKAPVDGDVKAECLSGEEKKRYKGGVLKSIKKEKRGRRRVLRGVAAACLALLFAGTVMLHGEVQAALLRLRWSISDALGSDLADYSEVIETPLADNGYVLTLQEVVITWDQVVVNATFVREDGAVIDPLEIPYGSLYINGKSAASSGGGGGMLLNEDGTVIGILQEFELYPENDFDLSKENEFRMVYEQDDIEEGRRGSWEFAFRASGKELIADTKRVQLDKTFELPDGVQMTLLGLTLNALEQRIYYKYSGQTLWDDFMVKAEEPDGTQTEFSIAKNTRAGGHMKNWTGQISGSAKTVRLTLYGRKRQENSIKYGEQVQIGEPFEVQL